MQNIGTKINNQPSSSDGVLTAEEFNNIMNELKNVVLSSSQTLQIGDVYQMAKAVAVYAVTGSFFLDSGVVNTYTLSIPGSRRPPAAYLDGMRIRFFAANTNSGSSTVNIAGIGSKNIKLPNGADLPAGTILAGSENELTFRESLDYFILSQYVRVTSNQTIFDKKTFDSVPGCNQDPVAGNDLVRLSYLNGVLSGSDSIPIGAELDWPGTVPPPKFVWRDGSSISRTTYAGAFAVLGTTYGSGDGSTTFNLPDSRGRVSVGKDNMGGTVANRVTTSGTVLGSSGGEEKHTQTVGELPSHSHTETGFSYGSGPVANGSGNGRTTTNTGSVGGGLPFNVMQPYIIENKIIKIS